MLSLFLMIPATVLGILLITQIGRADRMAVVEIVLCKGWSYRFKRQVLEEKKEAYLSDYGKYHSVSQKKAAKKVVGWNKEIEGYRKEEEKYLSGKKLSLPDVIPLFGYRIMDRLQMDANTDMLRALTKKCEHSGYIELEKKQETNGKANAQIYAKYLLAALVSYGTAGVVLACICVALTTALRLESVQSVILGGIALIGPTLAGYLPYDALQTRASVRQEAVDLDFPNVLSKLALLITAGMNLTNAVAETAGSGDTLMYRELRLVMKEMEQGATMAGAFARMQCRCENRFLDRLVSVATKSYTAGNANLAEDLREINAECWLEKKHGARRRTETIQNKLFVPTMLMFVGILVVIVVPAMAGFGL